MKFAVIETGGKQYKVSEGDVVKIEKLSDYKKDGKVTFDKVLLIDDGKTTEVGAPYIKGAKISAVFEEEGKGKKVHIVKFKSKSNYSKKIGHRQPFNKIKVEKI
ncbi:TPA: 50S ribosomal protein L21 [Candidatus Campbellbacteria bacterium]|jgi:large subunit ribosomal protein L21|uniref:Large ribosomal subunit protein bL21 n=2 Tax=Candidatus Campbelliibacteriota TaxID=1752727 RepID=A0A1F5EP04_9BACT|nr:MAG: LSU ribosomal protein L21P, large subunit ribosomal protein L21 [Candidatus Campbellbacteria bacterium GW2011_OD1_34_28]KKP74983.1 MAG: 50S ribosomal protein L21 [Candidatus Campbellbacteria bacterium GW2011_GWD2_35_24]KKP75869.1 MAG: LSU ribosomal protein L21P, large subunit ribosomal protein L21 [Candidatus Campbellbacteria bacterium GW2011_GWC2_35_28]KKP76883.1 MAG: 50S ribosomal protein L21 [Candidatus Campbellbacteria bacterium GW2011_GWC1_35_31]KKP78809.1 MAG: 50S ribosomal protei